MEELNYVPYGKQWQAEMKKMSKIKIIELAASIAIEKDSEIRLLENQNAELHEQVKQSLLLYNSLVKTNAELRLQIEKITDSIAWINRQDLEKQKAEQAARIEKTEKEYQEFVSEYHPYKYRAAKLQIDLTKTNARIAELEKQLKEAQEPKANFIKEENREHAEATFEKLKNLGKEPGTD
jgi:hypothetical protein